MAEEGGHGGVSADGGAVDFDEIGRVLGVFGGDGGELAAGFFEFEEFAGELGFAGAGGAHEEEWGFGGDGDFFDLFDEGVEFGVARFDAGFEEGEGFGLFLAEAGGDFVVLRKVEVDDGEGAAPPIFSFGGGASVGGCGLDELGGEVVGFGEEEEADLGDVGAGGDVDEVVFGIGVEGVGAGEVEEGGVDFLEVPGVGEFDAVGADVGGGGDLADVGGDGLDERGVFLLVEEFEAVDGEVGVLAEGDGGSPALPAVGSGAGVDDGAEEADDDGFSIGIGVHTGSLAEGAWD